MKARPERLRSAPKPREAPPSASPPKEAATVRFFWLGLRHASLPRPTGVLFSGFRDPDFSAATREVGVGVTCANFQTEGASSVRAEEEGRNQKLKGFLSDHPNGCLARSTSGQGFGTSVCFIGFAPLHTEHTDVTILIPYPSFVSILAQTLFFCIHVMLYYGTLHLQAYLRHVTS